MAKEVIVTSDKIKRQKIRARIVKISLLSLLLIMIIAYLVLKVIFNEGNFTILLDKQNDEDSGLAIYYSLNDPSPKRKLEAPSISFMDNISWKWLPADIDTESDGSHNGDNYVAYSFYIENQGKKSLHYWYEITIDDVIKNVDEAIRIMIFQNGEKTVYAKKNGLTGKPEPNTVPFIDDMDKTVILEKRADFKPDDLDRYTIVIFLEGDDPECVDALIGGGLKLKMTIRDQFIRKSKK